MDRFEHPNAEFAIRDKSHSEPVLPILFIKPNQDIWTDLKTERFTII